MHYSARIPTLEPWLSTITDPLTGKRRRTTYRLTIDEARDRYLDLESFDLVGKFPELP